MVIMVTEKYQKYQKYRSIFAQYDLFVFKIVMIYANKSGFMAVLTWNRLETVNCLGHGSKNRI